MRRFTAVMFALAITMVLCLFVQWGTTTWRMDTELDALGDMRTRMAWLEDQAVHRWLIRMLLFVAIPLGGVVSMLLMLRLTRRAPATASVAIPVAVVAGQQSAAAPNFMFRFAMICVTGVVAVLGYGAARGYHDYRRASEELTTLMPFYQERVARLEAAQAAEREAGAQWEAINERYVAYLFSNDDKKAKEVAPEMLASMRAWTQARQQRRNEEIVVESVVHDVQLYTRLAEQSCPWRLWNDTTRVANKVAN